MSSESVVALYFAISGSQASPADFDPHFAISGDRASPTDFATDVVVVVALHLTVSGGQASPADFAPAVWAAVAAVSQATGFRTSFTELFLGDHGTCAGQKRFL